MSAALKAPVTVMSNAGEGGAWGIALLAGFALKSGVSLTEYLSKIFARSASTTLMTDEREMQNFNAFMSTYKKCLAAEKLAAEEL